MWSFLWKCENSIRCMFSFVYRISQNWQNWRGEYTLHIQTWLWICVSMLQVCGLLRIGKSGLFAKCPFISNHTQLNEERGSEWMDPTVDFLLVKKTSNPFIPDAFTFGCCCATARSTRRTCCCCCRPRCRSECFQVYNCVQSNLPDRPPIMGKGSETPSVLDCISSDNEGIIWDMREREIREIRCRYEKNWFLYFKAA